MKYLRYLAVAVVAYCVGLFNLHLITGRPYHPAPPAAVARQAASSPAFMIVARLLDQGNTLQLETLPPPVASGITW